VQARDYKFANAEQYAKTRNKDIKRLYRDLGYNKLWPTKPFQGIIYFLIAAALMALCAAALIYVSWFGFQLTVTVLGLEAGYVFFIVLLFLVVLVFVQPIAFMLYRARGCFRPSASAILQHDRRKPTILLRSFADDESKSFWSLRGLGGDDPLVFLKFNALLTSARDLAAGVNRLERVFEWNLPGHGPLVAIGEPGELGPELGAARVYVANDEWQERVLTWLKQSSLIALIAPRSSGAKWELQKIFSMGLHRKLLLVFPPEGPPERERRAAFLASALAETPYRESVNAAFLEDAKVCIFQHEHIITVFFENVPEGDDTIVQSYDVCLDMAIKRIANGQKNALR
jgi:hypothetical protein